MPNYQNGKIYKITAGNLTYIGSTCEPTLARRLAKHKSDYNAWKNGKYAHTTSFTVIETGQYEITLIELFPCGSKDELTARERFHIETNVCVNQRIPNRTDIETKEVRVNRSKQFYEKHKEDIKEKSRLQKKNNKEQIDKVNKLYRDTHKEEISKRKKEWYKVNRSKSRPKHPEAIPLPSEYPQPS